MPRFHKYGPSVSLQAIETSVYAAPTVVGGFSASPRQARLTRINADK